MTSPAGARRVAELLLTHHPDADTELVYRSPFELLVATILSAQSTDRRVNLVTPTLFARYPTADALAAADPGTLEALIHSTGFFRAKARALIGMATALVDRYGGEVPRERDALTTLPGVGRKTANVVLGHAFAIPALPVDRHVLRVAARIGLAEGDDPEEVEHQLCAVIPEAQWTRFSDSLILHGRRICKPTPRCEGCAVRPVCRYATGQSARTPGRARSGSTRSASSTPAQKAPRGSSTVRTRRR